MRRRLLTLGIVTLLVVAGFLIIQLLHGTRGDRHYFTYRSINRADDLAEKCRIYHLKHPEKKYPAKLSDLKEPPAGVGPLLADPDADLTDAWGMPFRYALVPNENGELEPYVWTERNRNGKTLLHGAKRTADGTRVLFGVPDY